MQVARLFLNTRYLLIAILFGGLWFRLSPGVADDRSGGPTEPWSVAGISIVQPSLGNLTGTPTEAGLVSRSPLGIRRTCRHLAAVVSSSGLWCSLHMQLQQT